MDLFFTIVSYILLGFSIAIISGLFRVNSLAEQQFTAYVAFWPVVLLKNIYLCIKYILLSFPTIFKD